MGANSLGSSGGKITNGGFLLPRGSKVTLPICFDWSVEREPSGQGRLLPSVAHHLHKAIEYSDP